MSAPPEGLLESFPRLLTPGEVERLLDVSPNTVISRLGKRCVRTLGGHRRYYAEAVGVLLRARLTEAGVPEQFHDRIIAAQLAGEL